MAAQFLQSLEMHQCSSMLIHYDDVINRMAGSKQLKVKELTGLRLETRGRVIRTKANMT